MAIRNFKVGWATTDTPGDLWEGWAFPGTSNYDTFKTLAVAYQVPALKTLYVMNVKYHRSSAGVQWKIGYATASIADAAGPPAGAVTNLDSFVINGADLLTEANICMVVPTANYPYALGAGSGIHALAFGLVY